MYRYILISISCLFLFLPFPLLAKSEYKSVETDRFTSTFEAKKAAQKLAIKVGQGDYFHPSLGRYCRSKRTSTVTKIRINELVDLESESLVSLFSATVFFKGEC